MDSESHTQPAAAGTTSNQPRGRRSRPAGRRRARGGAHRAPRLTRRQRRAAQRAVEQAEMAKTIAWFGQVKALEDIDLEATQSRTVRDEEPVDLDVQDARLDEVWERWSAQHDAQMPREEPVERQ